MVVNLNSGAEEEKIPLTSGDTLLGKYLSLIVLSTSVADPGCLSRIPYPDFFSIPDPGSKNSNKRDGGKICCPTFFFAHENHKIVNYSNFELAEKKFGPICKEL